MDLKYDGFLYGNGLTLNLLYHLKQYIPQEKQYLLNIDDFLKKLIAGQASKREENKVFIGIYKKESVETRKFFNFTGIINVFPALYNIWWIILSEYLSFLKLDDKLENFYKSVDKVLGNPTNVWTTNFDLFSESLHPEHLHGYFLREIRGYQNYGTICNRRFSFIIFC